MAIDDTEWTDTSNDEQLQLQLIIGIVGVPLLISRAIFSALSMSYGPGWSDYWTLFELFYGLSTMTGVSGSAFLVVGTIAILKRNESDRAWILAGVYIFGWIWTFVYGYVIFPGVMGMEGIDDVLVISTISSIISYSVLAIRLFAWLSIRSSIAYRWAYYSYLLYMVTGGFISYIVSGLLVGFGSHQIRTPEEAFALEAPGLVVSIVGFVITLLFLISQLIDHRRIEIV